jgi:hypothetical protein
VAIAMRLDVTIPCTNIPIPAIQESGYDLKVYDEGRARGERGYSVYWMMMGYEFIYNTQTKKTAVNGRWYEWEERFYEKHCGIGEADIPSAENIAKVTMLFIVQQFAVVL